MKKVNIVAKFVIPIMLVLVIALFANLIWLTVRTTSTQQNGEQLITLSNELLNNNDYLVKLARRSIATQDTSVRAQYNSFLSDDESINGKIQAMEDFGLSQDELNRLSSIQNMMDGITAIETEAFNSYDSGDHEAAFQIAFGNEYSDYDERIATSIQELINTIQKRFDIDIEGLQNQQFLWLIILGLIVIITFVSGMLMLNWSVNKIHWYNSILDSLPFPLSITDNNRKWTFINKPVETMLSTTRDKMMGQPCSKWGAGICNTDNCGINCLKKGQSNTYFEQSGANFKVDIAYLTDQKGRQTGHIEIVQDISEMVKTQKAGSALVSNIETVSAQFVSASKQIADGANALAQGSTEQAAAVQQLSSSIAEVAQKTKENAVMAERAATLGNSIMSDAEKGNNQMNEMLEAVREINQANQNIHQVIQVIDNLAFQTNILALNASVEAARVGQHGKGFAVVAEEVRTLATKSADAAKNTSELIATSIAKAELGSRIANETASSLSGIVSGIRETDQLINDIAKSSEEQSQGIYQINIGIDQVSQVVQSNSATAEESAAASQEMNGQSAMLDELLVQYRMEFGGNDSVQHRLPEGRY